MDTQTYIQKISDTIYNGCNKKRRYKEILKNVETAVDNENISPVPYYYIGILNVLEDMSIQDYNDDAMEEKLKKYSRELTLDRLCVIVSDMFERHYDDDEEVVQEFRKGLDDVMVQNFGYQDILYQCTWTIIQNVRNIVQEFTLNIEEFDFGGFDKELTENLYDCIDCEDDFDDEDETEDEDEEYEPGSDEESESSDEESEDEGVHELLDKKIEEIRTLKERIEDLEFQVMSMKDINTKYSELLEINEQSSQEARKMFKYGFIVAFIMMFAPLMFQEPKFQLDQNLLI